MRRAGARLFGLMRRFGLDGRATAVVEFALVLPLMLLLYLGTMEASALISMDRRVQIVNGTVGDLVARANKEIASNQLRDYFRAAENIMQPFTTESLVQTVTLVAVSQSGSTQVRWSRRFVSGQANHTAGHGTGTSFALPAETIDVARGSYVIVSEASYVYTPLLGLVLPADFTLAKRNFYSPRFGTEIRFVS
jgi:Flp pilus assembly protein TadG